MYRYIYEKHHINNFLKTFFKGHYIEDIFLGTFLTVTEEPPSLAESLELVRRLRLLSTTQQPEIHPFIIQLQSKLTDVLLDSQVSKQKSIFDYFKTVNMS